MTDLGQTILANRRGETAFTNEPLYYGEPILAVAAVDELTAVEAIEKIEIEFEPLPFVVDPFESLRPGGANARTEGNVWFRPRRPRAAGRLPPLVVRETEMDEEDFAATQRGSAADGRGQSMNGRSAIWTPASRVRPSCSMKRS